MPTVSEPQRRAMWAAANGHSTLGIPKSVGKEFVGKDAMPKAGGIVFVAGDGDVLLLRRAKDEKNYGGHWALPGGKAEDGETCMDAARREFREECGLDIDLEANLRVLNEDETPNGMLFTTYAKATDTKFVPTLDAEHSGYCWASLDQLPRPMHPQVENLLGEHIGVNADMTAEQWEALRTNFAQWTREEEAEAEHAMDERLALDASVRTIDQDGHMHIQRAPISKANVCPYWGHEIPGAEELGLDLQRQYKLLRAPDELRKGAATSNGKQLMLGHIPVHARDPQKDKQVGTLGTDAEYVHPYLYNSLHLTDQEGIDAIEAADAGDPDGAKELSCGYRYDPDMTPGEYLGVPYDGIMRNIVFNHVALVPEGRAGADVVVGDSQIKGQGEVCMSGKVLSRFAGASAVAVAMYLQPRLAADAKLDLTPLFADVTRKNFKERKAKLAADIQTAAKTIGLAKDAKVDDVVNLLDKLESCVVAEGADEDPNSGLPMNAAEMEKKAKDEAEEKAKKEAEDRKARDAKANEFLKGKLSAEDFKAYDEMMGEAEDAESESAKENAEGAEGAGAGKAAKDKKGIDKKAMDEALKAHGDAIIKRMIETQEAYVAVEPWVGKLALGMDSATTVYRTALKGLGMDAKAVDALHPDALKPVLEAQRKPGEKQNQRIAQDANPGGDTSGFQSRWGDSVDRIGAA